MEKKKELKIEVRHKELFVDGVKTEDNVVIIKQLYSTEVMIIPTECVPELIKRLAVAIKQTPELVAGDK